MVLHPAHGYGRNMNPCIDCRILMLNWAKDYMKLAGAQFLITGEVLDQRPMSQRRHSFSEIDRLTELAGLVLRPLSAQLLEPTTPERTGLVDRSRLGAISGRSRKPQLELARRFNITEIPQPAGGCLLTDPGYSARLRDLIRYTPDPTPTDLNLLQVGRHFRLSATCKAIVGRDHEENLAIRSYPEPGDTLIEMHERLGPQTILRGACGPAEIALAGGITAAYSKPPQPDPATIRHWTLPSCDADAKILTVPLPTRDSFSHLRVGETSRQPESHPVRLVDRIPT